MKNNPEKIDINAGGMKEVLKIAFPLILSTSAFALQMFIDRVFLMWYDRDAMSGAMMGGILNFTFFSFFLGTATYVSTFVSQYDGANMPKRIGPAVWQSIYFSIAAGLIMAAIALFAAPLIRLVGHEPAIAGYELTYFRIMSLGSIAGITDSAVSCFLTGRGKTLTVMWVNIVKTITNVILDYAMIFGHFGFAKMGIAGAAAATIIAHIAGVIIYFVIFLRAANRGVYGTAIAGFDSELFGRLMRFGVPSGVQFTLDILGFTLFITFVGRIDAVSFAATAMAFQINSLAFMPMIGFGIATSVLVGRALGADRPDIAQKTVHSAAYITFSYMIFIAICYYTVPQFFMLPFKAQASAEQFAAISPIVKTLLLFVGFYCIFDTGNIIFSAALKGAGDTKFVMWVSVILNWVIMVIPSRLAITFLQGRARLYAAWFALAGYVCALAMLFFFRFLAGKWKTMRVIEKIPVLPENMPAVPAVEA
jgi:MATE family multidrug resistance protein